MFTKNQGTIPDVETTSPAEAELQATVRAKKGVRAIMNL
jgi:hypothetical protein